MPLRSEFRPSATGGGSDRALNDISLTVGFAMLVLIFALIPYLTAIHQVVVDLPSLAQTETAAESIGGSEVLLLDVAIRRDRAGTIWVTVNGEEVPPPRSLVDFISVNYHDELMDVGSIEVALRADRDLEYETVIGVLDSLQELGQHSAEVPRFSLLYTESGEAREGQGHREFNE